MKKTIVAFTLSAILIAAMPITAMAHGHGHSHDGNTPAVTGYTLCCEDNCNISGNHQHGGTTYAGHYLGDGHDYHQACTTQGCTETGTHDHNGTACLPHNTNGTSGSHHSGNHH